MRNTVLVLLGSAACLAYPGFLAAAEVVADDGFKALIANNMWILAALFALGLLVILCFVFYQNYGEWKEHRDHPLDPLKLQKHLTPSGRWRR